MLNLKQIEALLMVCHELTPNYQIIVDREDNLDTLEVCVEMGEELLADEIRKLQALESGLRKSIKEFLGVTATVDRSGSAPPETNLLINWPITMIAG